MTSYDDSVCECGRAHTRIARISGRVDDMLIIRGIKHVFPSQVEYALMMIPELGEQYQIVVDRKAALDTMLVRVEIKKQAFSDKISDLMAIKEKATHLLRNYLNMVVQTSNW